MEVKKIDCTFFEQVVVTLYHRVRNQRKRVPTVKLCDELRMMGDEFSNDGDKPFIGCLPEQATFGGMHYPHEEFLRTNDLLQYSTWRRLIRKFRKTQIDDPEVIQFTDELCARLNIVA